MSQSQIPGRWSQPTVWLVAIFMLGALLRFVLALSFSGSPVAIGDARDYNQLAIGIVERGEFAFKPAVPTSLRPPLYPTVLATLYRVFGVENFRVVFLLQNAIGLASAYLVFLLASAQFGSRTGLVAAAITCFYPSLVFLETQLLTEVIFTFFVLVMCFAVQRFLGSGSIWWLVVLGAFHGLATLTRSILWLFPPFLVCFVWFASGRRLSLSFGRRVACCVTPVAVFGLVIAPWAIRNTQLHRTFTTIDVMGGRNFMMGNYEHTPTFRAWDAIRMEGDQAWDNVLAKEVDNFSNLTQGQRDKLAMKRGLRFVVENPALTAKRDFVKFLNFWQLERTLAAGMKSGFWGTFSRPVVLFASVLPAGTYALVSLCAIVGLIFVRPAEVRLQIFFVLLIGFFCAVHTAVFAHERYRIPLMPVFSIFAASAVIQCRQIWHPRLFAKWALAGSICGFLVASWLWEIVFVEWGQIRSM